MADRTRLAGLLFPTLLALVCMSVLVALGTWQLQRKDWKDGLVARLKERASAQPIGLDQAMREWLETGDVEYTRVVVRGTYATEKQVRLYALRQGVAGWHLVAPLRTPAGEVVFVNRGFVPNSTRDDGAESAVKMAEAVEVTGLLRVPLVDQPWFTPANDPLKNVWYSVDLPAMAKSLGLAPGAPIAPFVIEAEPRPDSPSAAGAPKAGVTRTALSNPHLEYALTWYGLAFALVVVYAAFVGRHLRALRTGAGNSSVRDSPRFEQDARGL